MSNGAFVSHVKKTVSTYKAHHHIMSQHNISYLGEEYWFPGSEEPVESLVKDFTTGNKLTDTSIGNKTLLGAKQLEL